MTSSHLNNLSRTPVSKYTQFRGTGHQEFTLCILRCCSVTSIVAHQAPLSMGFSRQEDWSGLSCPFPVDLPNPGIIFMASARQAISTAGPPEKPCMHFKGTQSAYLNTLCFYIWGVSYIVNLFLQQLKPNSENSFHLA